MLSYLMWRQLYCRSPCFRDLLHPDWVHVGIVACGDRQPETSVAAKAIMVTATGNVFFHIFTEDELRKDFVAEVSCSRHIF